MKNMVCPNMHDAKVEGGLQREASTLNESTKDLILKGILRKIRMKTKEEGSIHDYDQVGQ